MLLKLNKKNSDLSKQNLASNKITKTTRGKCKQNQETPENNQESLGSKSLVSGSNV